MLAVPLGAALLATAPAQIISPAAGEWRTQPALSSRVEAATRVFFAGASGSYVDRRQLGPAARPGPQLSLWEQFWDVLTGVPQDPPRIAGALSIAGCIAHECPGSRAAAALSADGSVVKAAFLTYYPEKALEPEGVVFFASRKDFDPALERGETGGGTAPLQYPAWCRKATTAAATRQ